MGPALRLALKDLRLRVRDRSVFIIGIGTPLVLAFILNAVFSDALGGEALDLEFGVVDMDRTQVSSGFSEVLSSLEKEGLLHFSFYDDRLAATAAVEAGEIDAFFLVADGTGEAVTSGRPAAIEVVGDVDAPTSTQIAVSIAEQFGIGVSSVQLAVAAVSHLSPPLDPVAVGERAATMGSVYRLVETESAVRQLDGTTYFAAGMAVFFMFFTVQFGVVGLLEEDRDGTLARLLAAPVPRWSVVGGKALLAFALGLISMSVLVIATSLFMGASWGPVAGLAVLLAAGVLSAVGVMAMVAAAARSAEGAQNLGSIVAVILGMLGGSFFPVGRGGDLLASVSYLTPHAWFIRGLGDISGGAPWTAALPAAAAMGLFALATGGLGWFMLGRRMNR